MCRTTLTTLFTAGALAAASATAQAQNVTVDEGEFVLQVDGQEAGTESFTIRRVGAGDEAKIWATATVELDAGTAIVQMRPVLQTSAGRAPIRYQNKITGEEEAEVGIAKADRRFVAMIRSSRGDRERELRATPGAVFLEGTVAHQYYFLPEAPPEGTTVDVPIIVPRTGEQTRARMTTVGSETLRISGRAVEAVKVRLTVDGEDREVWRDSEGLVLRLVIPARNFRAERSEL
jgi:hypothetical protein